MRDQAQRGSASRKPALSEVEGDLLLLNRRDAEIAEADRAGLRKGP